MKAMKKNYMTPATEWLFVKSASLLTGSGVSGSGNGDAPGSDIGYGGTDDEGNMDPAARRHNDVWEDEEEDAED